MKLSLWFVTIVTFFLSQSAICKPRILIVGDSLTEGYGVQPNQAYPHLLQLKMRQEGTKEAIVINAGTSGATSAFGLRTLKFQVKRKKPDFLILALGANDALRGITPKQTEKNLAECLKYAKSHNIKTILVGMMAPPNYGTKFPKDFAAIFPRLQKAFSVPLIPFLLKGVAGESELNLPDGIHPNPKGYKIISEHLWESIKEHIK